MLLGAPDSEDLPTTQWRGWLRVKNLARARLGGLEILEAGSDERLQDRGSGIAEAGHNEWLEDLGSGRLNM